MHNITPARLTAQHVARALVAACLEVGENPVRVLTIDYSVYGHWHARHYAYHALACEIFAGAPTPLERKMIATAIGCRGPQGGFLQATHYNVLNCDYNHPPRARWFTFEALYRVRRAVVDGISLTPEQRICFAEGPAKTPTPPPNKVGRYERGADVPVFPGRKNTPAARQIPSPLPHIITRAKAQVPLTPTPIAMRREAVPPSQCEDMTSELMGDPPPGRSALAEYVAREMARQQRIMETQTDIDGGNKNGPNRVLC